MIAWPEKRQHRGLYALKVLILAVLLALCVVPPMLPTDTPQRQPEGTNGIAVEYHVSPKGADTNAGTSDAPFATLARARDAIRTLKATEGLPTGGVRVWLRDGTYSLDQTLTLTLGDSGRSDAPIIYQAYPGDEVRLMGGQELPSSAFTPVVDPQIRDRLVEAARDQVQQVDLGALGLNDFGPAWPDRFKGYARWMELFFEDEPMTLARWPNKGYAEVERVVEIGSRPRYDEKPDRPGTFVGKDDRPKRWKHIDPVYLNGYWAFKWYDECLKVASIDPETGQITFAAPHFYGLGGPSGGYYYALNLLEELDAPVEYYVDRETGVLYFWPPAPLPGKRLAVSLLQGPLVSLEYASFVVLRDLIFEVSRGRAVQVKGGTRNVIFGCTVRNVADDTIVIDGGTDHVVFGCEIDDVGKGGIVLSGGDRFTLSRAGHLAAQNHIHHYARLERTGKPGIELYGVGCLARQNLIHHAPHEAISFSGNEHVIEFNEIHHVCTETDDAGAIYTGRDWTARGNVIRYNFFHHISGGDHIGVQAIYLDDMASGTTVFGNVIAEAQRGILIGGGRDNVIENNLFVDCEQVLLFDARGLTWMKEHLDEGGILTQRLLSMPYQEEPWQSRYPNLVDILVDQPGAPKYNIVRHNVIAQSGEIEVEQKAQEHVTIESNLITDKDPGFVDASHMNLQLREDSLVYIQLPGFEAIPFSNIGIRQR